MKQEKRDRYRISGTCFYAHGRPGEICQQADGRPARRVGKMKLPCSFAQPGFHRHMGKCMESRRQAYNERIVYKEYGDGVKNRIMACLLLATLILGAGIYLYENGFQGLPASQSGGNFIKWVDFNASKEAMKKACLLDIESYESDVHLDWITLLAYAAVRGGGEFDSKSAGYIDDVAQKLAQKETTKEALTEKYKYFSYYYDAYSAVLGGMLGEYEIEEESGKFQKKYGLKAFSPIAGGFSYQDYDDFGVGRDFGYKRQHLGHDMMGLVGTPIIACESGYVEALGWNRYGGWRIGIRSFDKKRYYYYAHLRQNRPYAEGLKEGDYVTAGDVIGYMGHTGYSDKENVNNIKTVHLHVGLQLIFDESQKDGNNEIWVDFYQLAGFLSANRCEVVRNDATKEWRRKVKMKDPAVPQKQDSVKSTSNCFQQFPLAAEAASRRSTKFHAEKCQSTAFFITI